MRPAGLAAAREHVQHPLQAGAVEVQERLDELLALCPDGGSATASTSLDQPLDPLIRCRSQRPLVPASGPLRTRAA